MAQKISQMTEQTTASMTEAGTSDFLGGYTTTGGNANRKFSLAGLANYFLNKFKLSLGGSNQTVKAAIDSLNSKCAVFSHSIFTYEGSNIIVTALSDRQGFLLFGSKNDPNASMGCIINIDNRMTQPIVTNFGTSVIHATYGEDKKTIIIEVGSWGQPCILSDNDFSVVRA